MSHPEEISVRFQLLVWYTFLYNSKILLFYTVLHTFSQFFLAAEDVLLNRTQESSLFTWEIYQTTTNSFFSSSFLGTFLGAHNICTLYFQSEHEPELPQ